MDRFIRRENIKRYRKRLREVKDEAERCQIQKLLMEEEQKSCQRGSPRNRAPARLISCLTDDERMPPTPTR
jgi:hypothetical protein